MYKYLFETLLSVLLGIYFSWNIPRSGIADRTVILFLIF